MVCNLVRNLSYDPNFTLASRQHKNQKAEPPSSRQPGYLYKTRSFASPPRDGFAFAGILLKAKFSDNVKIYYSVQ
jgi:hypothetical protein